jgi:hypothetical protein
MTLRNELVPMVATHSERICAAWTVGLPLCAPQVLVVQVRCFGVRAGTGLMRAVLVSEFGGPERLRLGQAADPVPGPGQVRIAVHAAGVNPVDAGNLPEGPPLLRVAMYVFGVSRLAPVALLLSAQCAERRAHLF